MFYKVDSNKHALNNFKCHLTPKFIEFFKEVENLKLTVTTLQGQVIISQHLKNVFKAQINLQDQNSGMYLLSIQSNKSQKAILLVKGNL